MAIDASLIYVIKIISLKKMVIQRLVDCFKKTNGWASYHI